MYRARRSEPSASPTMYLLALILTLTTVILVLIPARASPADSVTAGSAKVKISGGIRNVQMVSVDLKDPSVRIEAALAQNRVGSVENLADMAMRKQSPDTEVLAAINGTFFHAYGEPPTPWGTIQTEGKFVHIGNTGTCIGFTADNKVRMDNLYVSIDGYLEDSGDWVNNWYAWNINHSYEDSSSIVIYTPEYGTRTPDHDLTSIVVENGTVREVVGGAARIPANGFTVVTGNNVIISRFTPGKKAEYRLEFSRARSGEPVDWEGVYTTIGAGPRLLKNGTICVAPEAEGFTEAKITANRGQRSFIGVRNDQVLIMGTVPNVTVYELAEIALSLGLCDAMNLDGGASSGLWYRGKYLTTPGRLLSNALVVTKKTGLERVSTNVQVVVNGKKLSCNPAPRIESSRVMLPMRVLFEAVGAEVTWNEKLKSVVAEKGDKNIILRLNSFKAEINGKTVDLDVPPRVTEGRVFVPLRFVGEALEAEVEWRAKEGAVYLWTVPEAG